MSDYEHREYQHHNGGNRSCAYREDWSPDEASDWCTCPIPAVKRKPAPLPEVPNMSLKTEPLILILQEPTHPDMPREEATRYIPSTDVAEADIILARNLDGTYRCLKHRHGEENVKVLQYVGGGHKPYDGEAAKSHLGANGFPKPQFSQPLTGASG